MMEQNGEQNTALCLNCQELLIKSELIKGKHTNQMVGLVLNQQNYAH